jgi:hypothetical protein
MPVDIYDLLASQDISVTTLTQLNSAIKNTVIDRTNTKFWNGPITVYRTIEASRTYPHGHPLPEASSVEALTVEDGAIGSLKPDSPSLFQVVSFFSTAAVSIILTDGAQSSLLTALSAGTPFVPPSPLIITPTLYLSIVNNSGEQAAVSIPYHTVGL